MSIPKPPIKGLKYETSIWEGILFALVIVLTGLSILMAIYAQYNFYTK